jgi:membrane-bound metal-dependent hydrolase YbcI (DUF457 family)
MSLPWWVAPAAVVVVLAVQPLLDRLDYDTQFALVGIVDWLGHLATGVVLVALLRPSRRVALGILLGSVLIDVDHLPSELGTDLLTAGSDRPYTHSLAILLAVAAAAAVTRSRLLLGGAIGLAGHLFRDIGTGDAGVPLLWPLSDTPAVVPFAVYVAVLAAVALIAARAAATPTAPRTPPR